MNLSAAQIDVIRRLDTLRGVRVVPVGLLTRAEIDELVALNLIVRTGVDTYCLAPNDRTGRIKAWHRAVTALPFDDVHAAAPGDFVAVHDGRRFEDPVEFDGYAKTEKLRYPRKGHDTGAYCWRETRPG